MFASMAKDLIVFLALATVATATGSWGDVKNYHGGKDDYSLTTQVTYETTTVCPVTSTYTEGGS
jgi:hypothetical protein